MNLNITNLIIVQILIILGLILTGYFIFREFRLMQYEKRFNLFSVSSKKSNKLSLFEKIYALLWKVIFNVSKFLNKFSIFRYYGKKYDYFIDQYRHPKRKGIHFFTIKVLIAFSLLVLAIISLSFQESELKLYILICVCLLGFFVPNIFFHIITDNRKMNLKNQLLSAIVILNNTLEHEKSLITSIALVKEQLSGQIKYEFEKIYNDMCYGLKNTTVFKRFATRTQLEIGYFIAIAIEANALEGNCEAVFRRAETILYEEKNLNRSKALFTKIYNIISYILMFIPFVICVTMLLIKRDYYQVFFESSYNILLLVFLFLCFCLYYYLILGNRRGIK